MNGLEAFKKIREYINRQHRKLINADIETVEGYPLDKIERELKVNQILKEKMVDLRWFFEIDLSINVESLLERYNGAKVSMETLKLEEITTIVEWLKEV